MPTYQYKCLNNHLCEETRGLKEDQKISACPECGNEIRQIYSPPGIHFKGGGFYRNSK